MRRFVGFDLAASERRLRRGERDVHLEPRAFDTLAYLAERPGQVVTKRELIEALWPGLAVTDNALTRCIAEVRKALDDDARQPRYIQTVPRSGYRFVARPLPEAAVNDDGARAAAARPAARRARRVRYLLGALFLALLAAIALLRPDRPHEDFERPARALPPRTIAVLPFVDLSADPVNRHLGDGLAENLLDLLASIPDLKVVARTSSFAFRGTDVDARAVGESLGVAWLLEGSVQRDENRLRVTVQLIDARTGYHAWSQRYDRDLADIFALQDEIATSTAARIGASIDSTQLASTVPSDNLDAYWHYLVGREHMRARGPDWRGHAAAAFEAAIAADEKFAAAHAGLATVLAIEGRFSHAHQEALLRRAETAATRALALQPGLAMAHAATGLILDFRGVSAAKVERHYRRALEIEPNLIEARNWLMAFMSKHGRYAESRAQLDLALAMDPVNPVLLENHSMNAERRGDNETALRAAERLLSLPHRPHIAFDRVASVHAAFGRLVPAVAAHSRGALELGPPYRLYHLGRAAVIHARLGLHEEARALLLEVGATEPPLAAGDWWVNVLVRAGELELLEESVREIIQASGLEDSEGATAALTLAAMLRGDHERAIALFEPLRENTEWLFLNRADFIPGPTEPGQLLALAYRRAGRTADAAGLLQRLLAFLERSERVRGGLQPGLLYEKAALFALLNDTPRALDTLDAAASAGWNDYYRAVHDVRWDAMRDSPPFHAIMEQSLAELGHQRAELAAATPLPFRAVSRPAPVPTE